MEKAEKKTMIQVLKQQDYRKAFDVITESNWWGDDSITNDTERENFLYKCYFNYYNLIFTEGVEGVAVREGHIYMHQLKLQLDKELEKIKKRIYLSEEEREEEEEREIRYKVIKPIYTGQIKVARIGDLLTVYQDNDRLGGKQVLMRGAREICEVGSSIEREHCQRVFM